MNSFAVQRIIMLLLVFNLVQTPVQGTQPVTPIQTQIAIDHLPPLGESATLTCEVTSVNDAPGTRAWIALPPETQVLNGELEWQGDLSANKTIRLVASIAFNSVGDREIDCRAYRPIDEDNSWGDSSPLYLSIGNTQTILGYALIPCYNELGRSSTLPPLTPEGLQNFPEFSCSYAGIWQDANNKNHYYSVHQQPLTRYEKQLVVIEFSLVADNLNNPSLSSTYVGTTRDFKLFPLAMENMISNPKFPVEITFQSENEGTLIPLCEACQLPAIKIQRLF